MRNVNLLATRLPSTLPMVITGTPAPSSTSAVSRTFASPNKVMSRPIKATAPPMPTMRANGAAASRALACSTSPCARHAAFDGSSAVMFTLPG
jgi:hypothetical protein